MTGKLDMHGWQYTIAIATPLVLLCMFYSASADEPAEILSTVKIHNYQFNLDNAVRTLASHNIQCSPQWDISNLYPALGDVDIRPNPLDPVPINPYAPPFPTQNPPSSVWQLPENPLVYQHIEGDKICTDYCTEPECLDYDEANDECYATREQCTTICVAIPEPGDNGDG